MKARYFLVLISLSFSGCSLIYSYSDDLPQRIDAWIKEKRYKTALNTIDYIKPTHKDYRLIQQKKKTILKQVIIYENESIEKTSKLANQGEWIVALKELDIVSENITNTKNIDKHRAKLLKNRAKIIENYEYKVLNKQASELVNKIELYEKIKKTVSSDENNNLDIAIFDQLRHETSLKLTQRSELQYQKGNFNNASESINLALKLNPDEDVTSRLKEIKALIKKENKLKTLSYVTAAKSLLNKLSQGYSHAILKETKEKIIWLNNNKENIGNDNKLIAKLEKHLIAGEKQNFEAGRKLYSKGKTQEALSIWLELKELEPEYPKLQSHINRAEKVINKLKKLSNKPVKK